MRSVIVLIFLGVCLFTVAIVVRSGMLARKDPGPPINAAMREAMGQRQLPPADLDEVQRKFPTAKVTESGLRYVITTPGHGPAPQIGQVVRASYRATFLDGSPFDASSEHGGPINFIVGQNHMLPGWDEGVATMREGEKRTLIIPYWLGYGDRGQKGKIPPKATLIFELELQELGPLPPPTTEG